MHHSERAGLERSGTASSAQSNEPRYEIAILYPLVGIDGDGAEHRFDRSSGRLFVLRDERIERVAKLAPGELNSWMARVRAESGWRTIRYLE